MRRPLGVVCLFLVLLTFLYTFFWKPPEGIPVDLDGRQVIINGVVSTYETKNNQKIFYLNKVTFSELTFSQEQRNYGVVCYMQGEEIPPLGSRVCVQGEISCFLEGTNPGEFNAKDFHLAEGDYFALYDATLLSVSRDYNVWKQGIQDFRLQCAKIIEQSMNAEAAGIMKAMLLGIRSDITEDSKKLYQESGISHVLAISGLHISMIGMGIYKILKRIGLTDYAAVPFAAVFLFHYGVLCGAGASTVRAILMFLLFLLSKIVKRSYDLQTALYLAAAILVIGNPFLLKYAGFWLSFTAVYGISVFSRGLKEGIEISNKRKKKVLESLLSCVGVAYFTLPPVLYFYFEYSLLSVWINMLVVPFLGALLGCGILVLAIGFFHMGAAVGVANICEGILWVIDKICCFFMMLPFQGYFTGKPQIWQILLFYGITFAMIAFKKKLKIHIKVSLMVWACVVLVWHPRVGCEVTFLDVGQGDAVCIQTQSGVCMIDGGSTSESRVGEYVILPFLKAEGIRTIDYWFVTHPDTDHCSGLLEILQSRYRELNIECIVLPAAEGISEDAEEIIRYGTAYGCKIVFMERGQEVNMQNGFLRCLHPENDYVTDDANTYSLTLYMQYGCGEFLFTGDATFASEEEIVRYLGDAGERISVDVLKVAHHGSRYSTSEAFLDMISPEISIISCGENNYGHPHEEVMERLEAVGSMVWSTKEYGAITVKVGEDVRVYGFLE